MRADHFSVRWIRRARFEGGTYVFKIDIVDDGIRLWVDDQLILDEWRHQVASFSPEVELTAGDHVIMVEYWEDFGAAGIKFSWERK